MMSGAVGFLEVLEQFAPGTKLRDAAELTLRQETGALLVFGSAPEVDAVCSGGFELRNAEFTAQRIAELAKMDGGIVVSADASLIMRANVQFIPDPAIETSETGTRFRTAERLAKQLGVPVLAVSEERRAVAVVFTGDNHFALRNPNELLAEGNQNLVALERLRRQLADAEDRLIRLEVDDGVTVRDVALLLARAALVRRMGAQIRRIVVELGGTGDLISIQASDLGEGVDNVLELVSDDYADRPMKPGEASDRLRNVPDESLKDLAVVAEALGLGNLDQAVRPRGGRALERVSRLPDNVKNSLLNHFGTLQKLLHASASELAEVEGVGRTRANQLRGHLDRLLQHGTPFGLVD
ncbi:DNA integrity scanning diadenylate cyclase DisA [soil metagenome]